MEKIQIRVSTDNRFLFDGVSIYYRTVSGDGPKVIGWPEPVVIKEAPLEEIPISREPLLRLPDYAAQELMDELWQAGLRPTELQVESNPQTISAMGKHIQDLQVQVAGQELTEKKLFELLNVDKECMYGWANRFLSYIEEVSLDIRKGA